MERAEFASSSNEDRWFLQRETRKAWIMSCTAPTKLVGIKPDTNRPLSVPASSRYRARRASHGARR